MSENDFRIRNGDSGSVAINVGASDVRGEEPAPNPSSGFILAFLSKMLRVAERANAKLPKLALGANVNLQDLAVFSNGTSDGNFSKFSFSDMDKAAEFIRFFADMVNDEEYFVAFLRAVEVSEESIEFLKKNKETIVMLANGASEGVLRAKMIADFFDRFKKYEGSKMKFLFEELKKSFEAWKKRPIKERVAGVLKVIMVLSLVFVAFSIGLLGILFLTAGLVVEKVADNCRLNKQKELSEKYAENAEKLSKLLAEYNKDNGCGNLITPPGEDLNRMALYNEISKLKSEQADLESKLTVLEKSTTEKVKSFIDCFKKNGIRSAFKQLKLDKYDLGFVGKLLFFGLTLSRIGISSLVGLGIAIASRVGELFLRNKSMDDVENKLEEDKRNIKKVLSLVKGGANAAAQFVANKIVPLSNDKPPGKGGVDDLYNI